MNRREFEFRPTLTVGKNRPGRRWKQDFPFVCICGFNTMNAKDAFEHTKECKYKPKGE